MQLLLWVKKVLAKNYNVLDLQRLKRCMLAKKTTGLNEVGKGYNSQGFFFFNAGITLETELNYEVNSGTRGLLASRAKRWACPGF